MHVYQSLSCIYLRVRDNFMAMQLNIPSKLVYGLREANAHVYHLVLILITKQLKQSYRASVMSYVFKTLDHIFIQVQHSCNFH